ncbi:hypothetical protein [Planococcus shenhongbingii]|uniref:Family 2 glycosyl transferase n=1 Tax=Planococcus shenhongbingii TaxID=3058398 RepID=A0ABT8N9H7_9BACL|nr:hypothetical protein [Planococcus sp. N017]MDN7244532.1 hypothetical protein [Planococcus sp. N017]
MRRIILSIVTLIIVLAFPFIIWSIQSKEQLQVAIIDKTVPTENYREHHGLTWLLNHNRYLKVDGSTYTNNSDYFGFVPNENKQTYDIREVPDSLAGTDLIYVADTYGVYNEDLSWNEPQEENAPSLLYGGLEIDEWNTIKDQVTQGGSDLIVEFNSFASPTTEDVRSDMTDFLGVDWTGWSGRYFGELSTSEEEVPKWVVTRYKKSGESWNYKGPGFVLVNDKKEEIVVLSEQQGDVGPEGIQVMFNDQGKELFALDQSPAFQYWFDISEPAVNGTVLADYKWDLTDEGSAILKEHGIPAQFPAIVQQQKNEADIYFFAGDFVDIGDIPDLYQYSGFAKIQSLLSFKAMESESAFYWKTYAPMMKSILAKTEQKESGKAIESAAAVQAESKGIKHPSRINGQTFEVYQDGKWQPFTVKGVNIGMAKPGTFPGEAAITREEYDRWFKQIGEMNANAIRVYTLHPPAFYEALKSYNETADEPLYLYHGVWVDEEPLVEKLDAFEADITKNFQAEIQKIVDVVHGNATVKEKPGHAAGTYKADVSPYVIGWVIGIEWFPDMVDEMNHLHPNLGDYDGEHIYTKNANPMEHWLAMQLDSLAEYELSNYDSMRPLSFTNWVTTDNLDQPAEPSDKEDIASVDPNHIKSKDIIHEVGMFASYHVYPYYPDFLNLEEKYTEFIDHRGERNNYAGYLKDLNDSHELPILIAEFGIPASRGKTHENPFGWNQGFISEQQQGEIVQHLYEDILNEEMLGGLVFTWQDEWFKRTWNTMDYDNPDRRPFWSNAQTNEQQFGLLSFDRHKVKVDGKDDWQDGTEIFEKGTKSLNSFTMDHDERYLYIKADFNDKDWWDQQDFNLYFNLREDNGIAVETAPGKKFNADFHLKISGKDSARLLVAGNYDSFYFDYAERLKMIPESKQDLSKVFHPIRLALNKEVTRPDTGEVLPFSAYETGILKYGIADPESAEYDSLNDWYYSEETGMLEIRIPWMLLNAKDPSQREFIGDMRKDGIEASIKVEGINTAVTLTDKKGTITDYFAEGQPGSYTWEEWELPKSKERLKQSYYILQDLFSNIE